MGLAKKIQPFLHEILLGFLLVAILLVAFKIDKKEFVSVSVQQGLFFNVWDMALLAVEVSTVIVAQVISIVFEVTGLIDAAPLTLLGIVWILELIRVAVQVSVMVSAYPLFLRETA